MHKPISLTDHVSLSDEQFRAMLLNAKKHTTGEVILLLNDSSDRMSFLLASLS
jgi:hypothetical protein